MTCEKIRERFADYLTGELEPDGRAELQAHFAGCGECRKEIESLSALWTELGLLAMEQPSPALRERFYGMLEAYREGQAPAPERTSLTQRFSGWIERLLPKKPVYQFVVSFLLLAAGFWAGFLWNTRSGAHTGEIVQLRSEVLEMNQMMAVSLLDRPSPSDRLKGVNWSAKLDQPSDQTLQALLRTLDSDPNVNVRLAAIDALYLFYKHPLVKDGLVRSLSRQTSPSVQIALIDLLVEIRERRASDALKLLIGGEKLNPDVKERAERGLAQLT